MLDPKKKVKKYVAAVLLLLLLAASISGLHIQSVKHYKEEQKRLVSDIIVADTNTGAAVAIEQGNDENLIDSKAVETNVPPVSPTAQPSGKVIGSTEVPEASYSPKKTEEKNTKSPTDPGERKNNRNSTKSDTSSKQTSTPARRKNNETAKPQKAHPKNPQKTSVVSAKEEQKASATPLEEQKSFVCGITIRCDSMLKHMEAVEEAVKDYIPTDGIILGQTSVKVEQGDTAYSLLQKVCQAKDIALDASYTNMYSSAYVRGIGHIYEKQAGLSSGWLYLVNGKLPGYGASRYRLKEGDQIEWVYSCTGKLE